MNEIKASLKVALSTREVPLIPGNLKHLYNYPHFLSISKIDNRAVVWYPTLDHLVRDRQIRTTLGKVLTKTTTLKDHEIRDIVAEFTLDQERKKVMEILWAKTPDEIQEVYENRNQDDCRKNAFEVAIDYLECLEDTVATGSHTDSCMGHSASNYKDGFHPVRIYGTSRDQNIQLAYMKDDDGILARVLCDMKNKVYVRSYQRYGTQGARKLIAGLQNLGFHEGRYLTGYVKAIAYDSSYIHMPYLDWSTRFDWSYGDDEIYLSGDGKHAGDNTSGLSNELDSTSGLTQCGCCGGYFDDNETTSVAGDSIVCDECLSVNYISAYNGRYPEWVSNEDAEYCEDNNCYYTQRGIEHHDMVYDVHGNLRDSDCVHWIEDMGEYYDRDDLFEDNEGELRHPDEVTLDWYLTEDGELAEKGDPEDGDTLLGELLYSKLWSVKRDRMVGYLMDNFNMSYTVAYALKQQLAPAAQWELFARKFDVEFDENDRPVVGGQYNLPLALAA